MRRRGVEVMVAQADAANPRQMAEVFARVRETMPPLRGVIHAAMVLDDCLLLKLTPERWQRVHGPKVTGAWNLHRLTEGLPLDFFVCFSSMSAVFGLAGQANYSSANTFLDGLAPYRRSRGLPGLTINWGYLGEVGYVARQEKIGERFESWGITSFSPKQALSIMSRLIGQGATQVGVMGVNWNKIASPGVTSGVSRRFADLATRAEEEVEGSGTSPRQLLLAVSGEKRKELLLSLVKDKVARVLGAASASLDVQKPLTELGLDSLMAVELRNWIEGELRVNLPVVELMKGPSVSRLGELLLDQFEGGDPAAAAPQTSTPAVGAATHLGNGQEAHAEGDLAEQVAGLSNEEVDSLLSTMMAEKEQTG
jgi:acyl carrier protein